MFHLYKRVVDKLEDMVFSNFETPMPFLALTDFPVDGYLCSLNT